MKKIYKTAISLGVAFALFSGVSFATIDLKDKATMGGISISVDANAVNLRVGETSNLLFQDYTLNKELKIKPNGTANVSFYVKADVTKDLTCSVETNGDLPIICNYGETEVTTNTELGKVGTSPKLYTLTFSLGEAAELEQTCNVTIKLGVK